MLVDTKIKGVTVVVARSGITFRGLQVEQMQAVLEVLVNAKLTLVEAELRPAA